VFFSFVSFFFDSRFHSICISEPYQIHTRVRQEKGQDIAGACGQLALVNPGNVTAPAAGGDIEDMAGSGGGSAAGKVRAVEKGSGKTAKGSAQCTGDAQTCQSADCSGGSRERVGDKKAAHTADGMMVKRELSRSALLCFANLLVPVGLLVVGVMKH
jgi:hypothetical protein